MGKRVYQADTGEVFETKAELEHYEHEQRVKAAFAEFDLYAPSEITPGMADRMIAALKPLASKRKRRTKAEMAEAA